jgi:sugar/nucleoside kinase (ribokinase family)
MARIMTIGEILVEIMATERGQSFRAPGTLVGPFPSGAPAIFIDQVGRLGRSAGIIGCVGDDDFGWLNIDRLRRDGVDTSAIALLADSQGRRSPSRCSPIARGFTSWVHRCSLRESPQPSARRSAW